MTKKTRNNILFFLILFAIALASILTGCKTPKVVETPPAPAVETPKEENNYQKWNPGIQQNLETLGVDVLKISFLNSSDIVLNQNLVKQIVQVVDGEVFLTDSVFKIEKMIDKLTPGILTQKTKQFSLPIIISFSDADKSYQMNFIYSKEENAFLLANNAIFSFRGVDYKVAPKTKEKCYLLFSLKKEKIVNDIQEKAEGVPQR